MIEDAGLHNPLPHLYNLQGKSRLKLCSLQEADIEEFSTIITLARSSKPKDEPKIGKEINQKGAKRVCRSSKCLKDTQVAQHGLERVSEEKNDENEMVRIEGAQRVLTGTNAVLLLGGETQWAIHHTYARCQVGNRGAK